MAAVKKNKAKYLFASECLTRRLLWLELPQEILTLIQRNRKIDPIVYYVSCYSPVTKAWVPTTSRRGGVCRRPQLQRVDETAFFEHFASDCPFTAERIARVERRMKWKAEVKLSISKSEPAIVVPFGIRQNPVFQNVERSYDLDFTSMVYLGGKEYYMSLQGTLFVVEKIDSCPTVTRVGVNRAIPSLSWRFFQEFLIRLDGEIILVLLIHQESLGVVDRVEVFRLCLRKIKWIRAERLGGKVVFLDPRTIWLNSVEVGCKGDRIYFTQASFGGWLVYDMKSRSISYI